jgi:hypothetical protein
MRVDMNENKTQGAFDDLKKVFQKSEAEEVKREEDREHIFIIRKSWRGHILPIFFLSLLIKSFFDSPNDVFSGYVICLPLLLDQFIRVFTSKLEINILKKEARFTNFYGTTIVKNIQSLSVDRSPFLLFAKSIGVAGLNDGVGLSSIKYSKEIDDLINTFQAD